MEVQKVKAVTGYFYDYILSDRMYRSVRLLLENRRLYEKDFNVSIYNGSIGYSRLSRIGVGNDLFDGCCSIHRILCPKTNAFNRYDEILGKTIEMAKPETLIILALGHTYSYSSCLRFVLV